MATSVQAIQELFTNLEQLQKLSTGSENKSIKEVYVDAVGSAERLAECLEHRTREYNKARNDVDIISEWMREAIQRLVKTKKELLKLQEDKKFMNDMKLVETAGVDPRPIEIPRALSAELSHSPSYESFKQKKQQSSSAGGSIRSGTSSPQPAFGIRKGWKSDPDVSMHNIQREVDALKIDNKRLKGSEKKLLKETLHLQRKNRVLEEEKNRAEDRLMIEQTQRDSTEKLRQRNRELEQQVQRLKEEYEVIKNQGEESEERVTTN